MDLLHRLDALFFMWGTQACAEPSAVTVILTIIGGANAVLYSARWFYVISQGLVGAIRASAGFWLWPPPSIK